MLLSELGREPLAHSSDLGREPLAHSSDLGDVASNQQSSVDYTSLNTSSPYGPHLLVRVSHTNRSNKRMCGYCDIQGKKYSNGSHVTSYYKCSACGIGLCRYPQECFDKFHELLQQYPNESPKSLLKYCKVWLPPLIKDWQLQDTYLILVLESSSCI